MIVDAEDRVVITKDDDFVYSFLVLDSPKRLLLVSTGNINNRDLRALFTERMPVLRQALERYRFVELTTPAVLLHE